MRLFSLILNTRYLFLGQSRAVKGLPEQKNKFTKVLRKAHEGKNRSQQERDILKPKEKVKRENFTTRQGWDAAYPGE